MRGDALSIAVRDSAVTAHATGNHCVINFDTPPCNPGSTARIKGQRPPSDTHCLGSAIANNQQLLESRGQVWGVETTLGNRSSIPGSASHILLDELEFGLRSRGGHAIVFDPLHPVVVPQRLRDVGNSLRSRTCVGPRPIPVLGPDSVPVSTRLDAAGWPFACCHGNLLSAYRSGVRSRAAALRLMDAMEIPRSLAIAPQHAVTALPVPFSSFVAGALAACVNRARFGKPLITEDEYLGDAALSAWHDALHDAMRSSSFALLSSPPLPVRRCHLVVAPPVFPGCILVDATGHLPSVALPPLGPSLVHSVAIQSSGAYHALPGTASRYRFVCDALGFAEPAVVFFCGFLSDAHVDGITDWEDREKEGEDGADAAGQLFLMSLQEVTAVLDTQELACIAKAEQNGLVDMEYVPFGVDAVQGLETIKTTGAVPISLVGLQSRNSRRVDQGWAPPAGTTVAAVELPVLEQVRTCFASLEERKSQYLRLSTSFGLAATERDLPPDNAALTCAADAPDTPKQTVVHVSGVFLQLHEADERPEPTPYFIVNVGGGGGNRPRLLLATAPYSPPVPKGKGKGKGKGKFPAKGRGGKGKGKQPPGGRGGGRGVAALVPDAEAPLSVVRGITAELEAVLGGAAVEGLLRRNLKEILKDIAGDKQEHYIQVVYPYSPPGRRLESAAPARRFDYKVQPLAVPMTDGLVSLLESESIEISHTSSWPLLHSMGNGVDGEAVALYLPGLAGTLLPFELASPPPPFVIHPSQSADPYQGLVLMERDELRRSLGFIATTPTASAMSLDPGPEVSAVWWSHPENEEPGRLINTFNVQMQQLSEHQAGYFRSFQADYQIRPAVIPALGCGDIRQSAPAQDVTTVYHLMPRNHAVSKQDIAEAPLPVAPLDWLRHLEVFVECKHGFVMVDQRVPLRRNGEDIPGIPDGSVSGSSSEDGGEEQAECIDPRCICQCVGWYSEWLQTQNGWQVTQTAMSCGARTVLTRPRTAAGDAEAVGFEFLATGPELEGLLAAGAAEFVVPVSQNTAALQVGSRLRVGVSDSSPVSWVSVREVSLHRSASAAAGYADPQPEIEATFYKRHGRGASAAAWCAGILSSACNVACVSVVTTDEEEVPPSLQVAQALASGDAFSLLAGTVPQEAECSVAENKVAQRPVPPDNARCEHNQDLCKQTIRVSLRWRALVNAALASQPGTVAEVVVPNGLAGLKKATVSPTCSSSLIASARRAHRLTALQAPTRMSNEVCTKAATS